MNRGAVIAIHLFHSEAELRDARMLRTALSPAIAGFLEDPSVVEVMLVGRGSIGCRADLSEPAKVYPRPTASASSASRIMSAPKFIQARRGSRPSCRKPARVRWSAAAGGRRAGVCNPQARRRCVWVRRRCRCLHHDLSRPARCAMRLQRARTSWSPAALRLAKRR